MARQVSDPHLFTIRVWLEELEQGHFECRGRLQHGPHGETRHFQGWAAMVDLMTGMVFTAPDADNATAGPGEQAGEPSAFEP